MKESDKIKLFNEVYRDNKEVIFRLCRGFLGASDEVEDLFQEIFIKVWNNLESFRGEAKVSTWIYRIGANTALRYRKKQHKRQHKEQLVEQFPPREAPVTLQDAPANAQPQDLSELLLLIQQLDKTDRILISMLLEGFSYKEMANVTGLKVNHVGVKINRIKKQLRKKMQLS